MNPLIELKTTPPLLITLALLCFALPQRAQAVSPAPDGGYPGGNTAEGQNALFSRTTGGFNTGVGWFSLKSLTTGSFNTGVGAGTLVLNSGDENTATGAGALLSNTTGTLNTANGAFALFGNTTGNNNNAFGFEALFSNTTGPFNNAFGNGALASNTTGDRNTAIGEGVMISSTTGSMNTAVGVSALRNNTTGSNNIAIGQDACNANASANFNTGVGVDVLINNTADANTAIGVAALFGNTTGSSNTAIGADALVFNTTGIGNIALGVDAGANVTTASNVICIGSNGENVSNSCFIGQIRDVQTAINDAIPVVIDSEGQLGTMSSSRRFKKEIKPMDKVSETILALKPVTFHYRSDKRDTPQFGLIAEEVAEVNPDLVVRNKDGKIYTVRYDAVNAMLLNEFLREHRRVQEQEAMITKVKSNTARQEVIIAHQQKQIDALTAGLQKMSAQLEASKPAPQVVLNNQ